MQNQSKSIINRMLRKIESEHNIHVLYACESGSRAWEMHSADSDYDIQFIYKRPVTDYLKLEPLPDCITLPIVGNLDFSGWDLGKALLLLRKSNPSLLEWLQSPIVYHADPDIQDSFAKLLDLYLNLNALRYHHRSLAMSSFHKHIDDGQVNYKKYLYALRSIFSIHWIDSHQTQPPIEFSKLMETQTDPTLIACVSQLLALKRAGGEKLEGPRIKAIDEYIKNALDALKPKPIINVPDLSALDEFFISQVLDKSH